VNVSCSKKIKLHCNTETERDLITSSKHAGFMLYIYFLIGYLDWPTNTFYFKFYWLTYPDRCCTWS